MKRLKNFGPFIGLNLLLLSGYGGTAFAASGGEAVKLRFDLVPGKTYVQKMSVKQGMSLPIAGQSMEQQMEMQFRTRMGVTATEEVGHKNVEVTYERVRMKMTMAGQEIMFDSDDPDGGHQALGMGVKGLVGVNLRMELDENGKLVHLEGIESLKEGQPPQSRKAMEPFLNQDNIAQMTNLWVVQALPDRSVSKGDSWPVDIKTAMPQLGHISMKGTYTHEGMEFIDGHDCVAIGMDMSLEMDVSGMAAANPQMQAMGMEFKDGKLTGTMYWDSDIGYPRRTDMTQSFTMTMRSPRNGETVEVPLTQHVELTTTTE